MTSEEYVFELEEEKEEVVDILGIRVSPLVAVGGGLAIGLLLVNLFMKEK